MIPAQGLGWSAVGGKSKAKELVVLGRHPFRHVLRLLLFVEDFELLRVQRLERLRRGLHMGMSVVNKSDC